jgi:cell division protein FtsW
MILFSASASFKDKAGHETPYQYLDKQLIGVAVATGLALIVRWLDLERIRRHVWIVGALSLLVLLLVLVPGLGRSINGSRRWLGAGSLAVQVSEFAKLAMVFCLAHYLALNQTRIGELRRGFLLPLVLVGGFALLLVFEPDYGMAALTVAVGLILLFLAGARWRYLVSTILVVVVGFALLVLHNPNRRSRVLEFWNQEPPQLTAALGAYAVGGVGGVGLGQGRQQHAYLPEAQTDMILPVVGEELGLVATLGVVAAFGVIFVAGLAQIRRAPNLFQFLLVAGALLLLSLQALINLMSVTKLVPPKGMPLPFLSAGLSNLMLMGLIVGLMLNAQRCWPRTGLAPQRSLEEMSE